MINSLEGFIEVAGVAHEFPVHAKSFKQLQIQETFEIPAVKPDIEQLLRITAHVQVISVRILSTPCSISYEGQMLTGLKAIIEGQIEQKVEYVADAPDQAVHAAHSTVLFSSYIVLDSRFTCAMEPAVTPYIEDIYVKQIDKRKIFKNIMLLLDAVPPANL